MARLGGAGFPNKQMGICSLTWQMTTFILLSRDVPIKRHELEVTRVLEVTEVLGN